MDDLGNTFPGKFIFFTELRVWCDFKRKLSEGLFQRKQIINTRGLLTEPLHDSFYAPQKFWWIICCSVYLKNYQKVAKVWSPSKMLNVLRTRKDYSLDIVWKPCIWIFLNLLVTELCRWIKGLNNLRDFYFITEWG